jgi:2-(1,2-epoxy-1,2-dihydrophenyl)acetyl-CoA isomerase
MRPSLSFNESNPIYSTQQRDEVVLLKWQGDLLMHAVDLGIRDHVLGFFERISRSDAVKVLVMLNTSARTGRREYLEFYRRAMASTLDPKAIHRLCNVFDQFILSLVELNKIVIHADCGQVIPLFLNMSLACDHRIVDENTVFQNPYLELGLIPKGGGVFFLSRILGCGAAFRLLTSGEDIPAASAKELGIVDEVVCCEDLESAAMARAADFASRPMRSIVGIKRLFNFCRQDLREYLEFETQEMLKLFGQPEM